MQVIAGGAYAYIAENPDFRDIRKKYPLCSADIVPKLFINSLKYFMVNIPTHFVA